jgi:hypothetical protein
MEKLVDTRLVQESVLPYILADTVFMMERKCFGLTTRRIKRMAY